MRRFLIGAEVLPGGGAHFRVWAPSRRRLEVLLDGAAVELAAEPGGYFSGIVQQAGAGTRYRFRVDGGESFPDPASRFQPAGPHGDSQVTDPAFAWTDAAWQGCRLEGQVIYEMHVGTFTPEGTWDAARQQLRHLADTGITVIEVMPVADFPGRFGWGYDGVSLFAPTRLYGAPGDFRRFVNEAHSFNLGVILDVVYNHLGPDGNHLAAFAPAYFARGCPNPWGVSLNFDGENSGPVREFFLANAAYWIAEFHLDGLRLDATEHICDGSAEHILIGIAESVRRAAAGRDTIVIAENEAQEASLARPVASGGLGLDAIWNEDFYRSAMVAMTGRREAYYVDHRGSPQELISATKHGFLYQGQRYQWRNRRRGTPAWDLRPAQFVTFFQNHDQVSNSARGLRISEMTSPAKLRAMSALLLLGPNTPLLFQGQEFAASSPFLFFADHKPELNRRVREGRARYLSQFPGEYTDDPANLATFERCKLDFSDRQRHAPMYQLHKDLLRLRREDVVFRGQRPGGVDGAVLGQDAFVLRFFGQADGDRLLIVNLGPDLNLETEPEPLIAPPESANWRVVWSSEDARYGGAGSEVECRDSWRIPGDSATVLG